jgi:hypothetical protein
MTGRYLIRAAAAVAALSATATAALACACGCGVFEVGPGSVMPAGDSLFMQYDFLDQNRNHSGGSQAPAANNDDKGITTDFVTFGGQYSLGPDWSAMAEVPYWDRAFRTDTGSGIETFHHAAFGDMRLMGVYSGLSSGTSTTAVTFGVKLPTGDFRYANFDPDVQIGTGSTDALLGVYHSGPLAGSFVWYGQVLWDKPLAFQAGYTPGSEVDGALGVFYAGYAVGDVQITPMVQTIFASRLRDGGATGDPDNTGYSRVLVAPGIEVMLGRWSLYGDVELPVYQYVNGNQLVAQQQFKLVLSYSLDG